MVFCCCSFPTLFLRFFLITNFGIRLCLTLEKLFYEIVNSLSFFLWWYKWNYKFKEISFKNHSLEKEKGNIWLILKSTRKGSPGEKCVKLFFLAWTTQGRKTCFVVFYIKHGSARGGRHTMHPGYLRLFRTWFQVTFQRFRWKLESRTDQWPARDFSFPRKIIIGKDFPIPNPATTAIPTGNENSSLAFYIKHRSPRGGLPTTLLSPDLCPTISKPHTTRENLGEVGGDRPLGIVGSTVFSTLHCKALVILKFLSSYT